MTKKNCNLYKRENIAYFVSETNVFTNIYVLIYIIN